MSIQEEVRKRLIRYLVMRAIVCPITGKVLDTDSCAVVLDADGDPSSVYDPEVKARFEASRSDLPEGFTWMERS